MPLAVHLHGALQGVSTDSELAAATAAHLQAAARSRLLQLLPGAEPSATAGGAGRGDGGAWAGAQPSGGGLGLAAYSASDEFGGGGE